MEYKKAGGNIVGCISEIKIKQLVHNYSKYYSINKFFIKSYLYKTHHKNVLQQLKKKSKKTCI